MIAKWENECVSLSVLKARVQFPALTEHFKELSMADHMWMQAEILLTTFWKRGVKKSVGRFLHHNRTVAGAPAGYLHHS